MHTNDHEAPAECFSFYVQTVHPAAHERRMGLQRCSCAHAALFVGMRKFNADILSWPNKELLQLCCDWGRGKLHTSHT